MHPAILGKRITEMRLRILLLTVVGVAYGEDKAAYTFGTTVVDSSGLQGRVYHLESNSEKLPNLSRLLPVGIIYTPSLNVWPQDFTEGFPSITERFEWFAIQYTGNIWIEKPGQYRFSILADDGAKLFINNKLVINNDGLHRAEAVSAAANLTRGVHQLKIDYFQGPRFSVALVLAVAGPGEPWRILNLHDFKPPKDPENWLKGKISDITRQTLD
jgi:hypothetical protein